MSNLNDAPSFAALRDELESIDVETFEILDHLEVGMDLAAAPAPGCSCIGTNSTSCCSG